MPAPHLERSGGFLFVFGAIKGIISVVFVTGMQILVRGISHFPFHLHFKIILCLTSAAISCNICGLGGNNLSLAEDHLCVFLVCFM